MKTNSGASFVGASFALAFIVVGFFGAWHWHDAKTRQQLDDSRASRNLAVMQMTLDNTLEQLTHDAQRLAQSPLLGLYVLQPTPLNLNIVEQAFLTVARLRPSHEQVRYINLAGHEVIRVDREAAEPLTRPHTLQDKSGRGYVQVGLNLAPDETLVSDLDLNIEHGQIEVPHQPTIRAVAPVFINAQRQGLVVLNTDGNQLIRQLSRTLIANNELVLLTDTGGWLQGNPEENWAFLADPERTLRARQPELWTSLQALPQGQFELDQECYRFQWYQYQARGVLAPRLMLAQRSAGASCNTMVQNAIVQTAWQSTLVLAISLPLLALWWRSRRKSQRYAQALNATLAQLHVIVRESGHALLLLDHQGTVQWLNPEAERLLGWQEHELKGQSLHDHVHIDTAGNSVHQGECAFLQALRTGQRTQIDTDLLLHKNGNRLFLSNRVTPFGPANERQAIVALADVSDHVERNHTLTTLAFTDELTGVLNRRSILNYLDKTLAQPKIGTCILTLDIDFFKRVNDTHGHEAGDQVLIQFCRTIAAQLRKSDQLGRVGGEEFLLVLPNTTLPDALALAERIRLAIAETPCQLNTGAVLSITTSTGAAQHAPGEAAHALLARADAALYNAKHNGRNRVAAAAPPVHPPAQRH